MTTAAEAQATAQFAPVDARPDFPALEQRTLAWWATQRIVEQYLHRNDAAERRYSFIDGPITANNKMGVHHAWGRTYKDVFQRFHTMLGERQRYQNGFDCQGLWVEVEVEKELGMKNKRDIETFGIDRFVNKCKERVLTYSAIQTEQSIRLGYWMDWDNSYYTMSDENNYTIWHFLKTCAERGLLYKGHDTMPWCPRCGTGLSEHELNEGYRDVTHTSVYVRFPLRERAGEYLLVWTTTPWTLPANVAAAVHPSLTYVRVRQDNAVYYLAKGTVSHVIKGDHEVLGELTGQELAGLAYSGPFDDLPAAAHLDHRVITWSDVSDSEGTGIVHIAPGCGKEDFHLSRQTGIAVLAPIDDFGVYVGGYDWLTGQFAGDVSRAIFANLREKALLFRTESYLHRYPHCWRCGTELLFRLVDEWYISMDGLRDQIMDVVRQIRWLPDFGLERELDWLRNMGDWMISKKRYWGLALPIYPCAACGHVDVIGSDDELRERAVTGWAEFDGHSPHRPWIDAVTIACSACGAPVSRISDVGNPWLDAGIVAYSTLDYRHDRAYWNEWFPAHFITESFPGQFRNWFYSLLTMSTVLENRPPFETVLGFGLMRDAKGEEMHKSKGNAIWFDDAATQAGADVMRWVFMNHNPASNLNFGYGATDDARRRFVLPLWNVYSFFVMYANIDGFHPVHRQAMPLAERPALDRWILAELNDLIGECTTALMEYDAARSTRALEAFVENLSNWYVRRGRRRFWKSDGDADKLAAYHTLYMVLTTVTRLLAPLLPFLSEELYQNLVRSVDSTAPSSVHLTDWPTTQADYNNPDLLQATRLVLRVVGVGRAARSTHKLKVRQPLAVAMVGLRWPEERALLEPFVDQIADELNVKAVDFLEAGKAGEVATEILRPNMPVIGAALGARTPQLLAMLKSGQLGAAVLDAVRAGQPASVAFADGTRATLPADALAVQLNARAGYAVAAQGGYLVAYPTGLSNDLMDEGLAREIAHRLNTMRKTGGFDISDRVTITYSASERVARILVDHAAYIGAEVLAESLRAGRDIREDNLSGVCYQEALSIDDDTARFLLRKSPTTTV